MTESELTHRMRARYQRIADAQYYRDVTPPSVHDVMAALADEVRQYDREQTAKLRAEHHKIGMVHASHEDCGICDLKRASDDAEARS